MKFTEPPADAYPSSHQLGPEDKRFSAYDRTMLSLIAQITRRIKHAEDLYLGKASVPHHRDDPYGPTEGEAFVEEVSNIQRWATLLLRLSDSYHKSEATSQLIDRITQEIKEPKTEYNHSYDDPPITP